MIEPGQSFANGRYVITQPLAQGGFGSVFQASDKRLARDVAIKVLKSAAPDLQARFFREARLIASLNHRNIVNIYDYGVERGDLYIVQELLEGETLAQILARAEHISLPYALEILAQVADALAFAHSRQIVHRDVKPANIFLVKTGDVKLLDFGVAKLTGDAEATDEVVVGTLAYLSPEQVSGAEVDARADIFSFGAVAYEIITGRRLFEAPSLPETVGRILQGEIQRLSTIVPDCPPALDDLIASCIERDRSLRPPTMSGVVVELRDILGELGRTSDATAWVDRDYGNIVKSPERPLAPPPDTGTMLGPVMAPNWAPAAEPAVRAPEQSPQPQTLAPGTRMGKFTVHELVACGQTGHLYKAFDPVRSRLVGLKVINNPSGVAVDRLLRAARIWLDLRHPNLQTILEVDPGAATSSALIATELIEGVDLETLTVQRKLNLLQKIEICLQVCDALEYMHTRGIVHREIKPRNIVLSHPDLHVTLLDSGLARSMSAKELSLTGTGLVVGDLHFMAPEQMLGRSDQRSDIYSLGVVLYALLFDSDLKTMKFMSKRAPVDQTPHVTGTELREQLQQAEGLPQKLVATLLLALQDDPERRFASVREFADALRSFVPEKLPPLRLSQVVVTLHGIRTHARWQRAFSEVASRAGLLCRLDRWNFGYFSVLKFLAPWSRHAKVAWFRSTYHDEFGEQATSPLSDERPSIVAHSFGTYILGNALLRYPYLRFNKVLLCGSILPEAFPWDVLIDRGQVQSVRNEYGARDFWAGIARRFVPGTGRSGLAGFSCEHVRLEQERFDYAHSEYFEKGHMEDCWLPFFRRRLSHITPREVPVVIPTGARPVGLYCVYAAALAIASFVVFYF